VIPAGLELTQHVHKFDHLSYLVKGSVMLEVDGKSEVHYAPKSFVIEAGKEHKVTSLSEAVWLCIHASDCTDPEKVDETLIA
jgi:quercetin dioxygenase-like cupin family protein